MSNIQIFEQKSENNLSDICPKYVIKYPFNELNAQRATIKKLQRSSTFSPKYLKNLEYIQNTRDKPSNPPSSGHRLPKLVPPNSSNRLNIPSILSKRQQLRRQNSPKDKEEELVTRLSVINRLKTQSAIKSEDSEVIVCAHVRVINCDDQIITNDSLLNVKRFGDSFDNHQEDRMFHHSKKWNRSKTEVVDNRLDAKKLLKAFKICQMKQDLQFGQLDKLNRHSVFIKHWNFFHHAWSCQKLIAEKTETLGNYFRSVKKYLVFLDGN